MHASSPCSFSLPVVNVHMMSFPASFGLDSRFPAGRDHHSHPPMVTGGGVRRIGARFSFFSDVLFLIALRLVFGYCSGEIKPPPPPYHGGRWWWIQIWGLYVVYDDH